MRMEDKIAKLLSVTAQLSKILKQENEILATDGRAKGIQPLLEEKVALSNAYEQQLKIIRSDEGLSDVDPSLKRRLQDAVSSFAPLLEENALRVKAKLDAGEHLLRIISESAKAHRGKSNGYGHNGAVADDSRQAYQPPVSLGLNQEF